ncbi:MAG: protein-export membrane protein SecD [Candidatus Aminicenantes bacterium RBG_13_59_9]|jgi:preprotein translocase subunit SecD|nr:MAG: protein-export membrane protein SecD [Candidatus Aminicenantes bacterium RBG_13_59_9]
MKKGLQWKLILTLGITALAIFLFFPPKDKIKLGLDLKGGIHLVLQVMTEDAVTIETDQEISRLQEQLKKKNITFKAMAKGEIGKFTIQGLGADQEAGLKTILDENFQEWDYSFLGETVSLQMKDAAVRYLKEQAITQALETIRNRVDVMGVSEPMIQRQGMAGDRIVVELPGIEDPERVKSIIKTTAILEWKLVRAGPAPDEAALLASTGGVVPDDAQVIKGDPKRQEVGFYLVDKVATVSGKDLRTVRRSADEWNSPAVSFSLDPDGGRRFEKATGENIGKQIAIILDNKVISAPRVESVIPAATGGIIRGRFTVEEAEDLVVVLKAGSLPAGIRYLEERTVGPSLGADSVRQGLISFLVAIVAVMSFMIVFYRLSGLNAVVALILNMVILFGALAYFHAALTLPGIAGIILSVGMAVDANVLIFERIKEEKALGKGILSSISTGFSRAFSAIFDSNLTTIISAIFLFQFGTGPIRGYATTLIIGLVANMFTAVFVSRLIFDITVPKSAKKLSI